MRDFCKFGQLSMLAVSPRIVCMRCPLHFQFYKEKFGWKPEDYPNAMKVGRSTVSIPITAKLSDRDVDDVVAAVRAVLN